MVWVSSEDSKDEASVKQLFKQTRWKKKEIDWQLNFHDSISLRSDPIHLSPTKTETQQSDSLLPPVIQYMIFCI